MAPNRLQGTEPMNDIYEFHLDDNVYRLNTNAQLKVISRKVEPPPKKTYQVNEAIYKEFPDKRKASPMPKDYIQYNGKEVETDEEAVEYDLDDEDAVWLELINERRKKEKLKPLTEKLLEKGIDRFEKASYFQNTDIAKTAAVDNDAVCCICQDGDDSNVNQIIFCDMCNISVHQECYGVPYIPAGQWLCRRCQLSPSENVKCVFCPYLGGAFKQTSDNQWAHVVCALWLNEVHFANAVFLEPVEGVAHSLRRRCKLTCGVCRIKMGACLQCSTKSCVKAFHVTCAVFAELHMKVETQEKEGSTDTIVNRFAFCSNHTAIIKKNKPASEAAFKRQTQEKFKKARKILQSANTQSSHQVSVPVISTQKLNDIRDQLKVDKLEDLLAYWSMKRRSRCGVPLIRRLQVYTSRKQLGRRSNEGLLDDSENVSPVGDVIPQLSGIRKELAEQLYRTGKLRNNLEKLRLLVELTKKREKYKLEMVENYRQIIENTLKPTHEIIKQVLDKLIEKDHQNVFMHPVNEKEVPGYHKIIKRPMDFDKMQTKLQNGDYKKIADLRADFELMMNNCAQFNKDNQYFWRYGNQMRSLGAKIMKAAELDEQTASTGTLMIDMIPIIFGDEDMDDEMRDFLKQYNAKPTDEQQVTEQKKRKVSNASIRRRSTAESTSGLKDTKIIDYFKPAVASPPSSPSSRSRKHAAETPATAPNPKKSRQASAAAHVSSEEEDAEAISADEEIQRRKQTSKSKRRSGTKTSRSKQRSSPRHPPSSSHSEQYKHDDIVWAQLNSERLPARVFERPMLTFEDDRDVADRIQQLNIESGKILVVFFDTDKTVRYFPESELEHCDMNQRLARGEPASLTAAFKRAKDYWTQAVEDEE